MFFLCTLIPGSLHKNARIFKENPCAVTNRQEKTGWKHIGCRSCRRKHHSRQMSQANVPFRFLCFPYNPWDWYIYLHQLGGGFKYFLFSPRTLRKMNPIWRAYFSDGWEKTTKPAKHRNQPNVCVNKCIPIPWVTYGHGFGTGVARTLAITIGGPKLLIVGKHGVTTYGDPKNGRK